MKIQLLRNGILIVITLLWMGLIFYMSAKPATESAGMSGGIAESICRVLIPDYPTLSVAEQQVRARGVDHWVRKSAHFFEYSLLGFLLFLDFSLVFSFTTRKKMLFSFFCGALYAASDEFHQLFVDGRSGQISDVFLDSCGVLTGCLLGMAIAFLYSKHKNVVK